MKITNNNNNNNTPITHNSTKIKISSNNKININKISVNH